jgi:hypothetical protein
MIRQFLFTFFFLLFFNSVYAKGINCNFFVDKIFEGKSGKFLKSKIYSDEKKFTISVNNLKKIRSGVYEGNLNGANHENRKVEIFEHSKFIEILQTDAYSTPYRSIYTIFTKQNSKNGGFLSSMYSNYESNWGHAVVKYYRGNCTIN